MQDRFETARPDLWSEGTLASTRTVAAKSSSNASFPSWTSPVRIRSPTPESTSYGHSKNLHSIAFH